VTLHLHTDDFTNHTSTDQDLEYGDLDRDTLLELAATGDEGAANHMETHREDAPTGARSVLYELGLRWEPSLISEDVATDQPLHRGVRVTPDQLAEFAKLQPGDVIPIRAASFTASEGFEGEGDRAVDVVLAPGSRGLPLESEWVVGCALLVDEVEATEDGVRVHVHTVENEVEGSP
jgi:hypothetical protein